MITIGSLIDVDNECLIVVSMRYNPTNGECVLSVGSAETGRVESICEIDSKTVDLTRVSLPEAYSIALAGGWNARHSIGFRQPLSARRVEGTYKSPFSTQSPSYTKPEKQKSKKRPWLFGKGTKVGDPVWVKAGHRNHCLIGEIVEIDRHQLTVVGVSGEGNTVRLQVNRASGIKPHMVYLGGDVWQKDRFGAIDGYAWPMKEPYMTQATNLISLWCRPKHINWFFDLRDGVMTDEARSKLLGELDEWAIELESSDPRDWSWPQFALFYEWAIKNGATPCVRDKELQFAITYHLNQLKELNSGSK